MAASSFALASAQTPEEIEQYKKMTIFQVGLATAINNEPYRGLDDSPTILPVPFYVYNKNNLTLAGPNVSYRFWRPLDVQLSAEGRYRFQNYDEDDSPFLEGLGNRNGTFEVGIKGQKRINRLRLQAQAMTDVAGQHDGHELQAQATFEVGNGRMISFRPTGGVNYLSQNVVHYYYGVNPGEARLNLPTGEGDFMDRTAFRGESAFVPFTGAEVRIRLSRRFALSGQVKASFLPEEITDSPIVGSSTRTSAFIGLSYGLSGPGIKKGQWW
ncbi:MipA/OmpV family protein [Parvularcula maris]|uniref:MipA/OmpV family protein n=1 Tax=Parvularcula maris TaxID=2965077 RepID=A0A9X2LBZ9_9PROT|nr:MipA/OmpV family protein [Parvularcula maris]MCQ8185752.1 MipA/OmpV family protein [Parvularcula maris]